MPWGSAWVVITIGFVALLLYRRSLTKNESDWIPLTDDAKEDSAIQAQTIIEMKTRKLTVPIRALGSLSLVMLLVIVDSALRTPHSALEKARYTFQSKSALAHRASCQA